VDRGGSVVLGSGWLRRGAIGAATTKVTIKGADGDFHGKVKSSKENCLGGRKVIDGHRRRRH
jgi:hypothetical protein